MHVSIKDIVRLVAREANVSVSAVAGESRLSHLVRLRHLAMWIARKVMPEASIARIASVVASTDHKSAYNAIRQTEQRFATDPELCLLRDRVLARVEEIRAASPSKVTHSKVEVMRYPLPKDGRIQVGSLVPPTPEYVTQRVRMERSYPERFRGGAAARTVTGGEA
jgi:hypothetical protein